MLKTKKKRPERDDTARIIARIHGVSVRYVQMVRAGLRKNEEITASLVDFRLRKNALIKSIKNEVPTPIKKKNGRKKN